MKRNFVQDVIPPKKTIRNVELLYRSRRSEKNTEEIPQEIIKPKPIAVQNVPVTNFETKPQEENFS